MEESRDLSRRFLITSGVLVLLVAPVLGWTARKIQSPQASNVLSEQRIQEIVRASAGSDVTVRSYKTSESWWYTAFVTNSKDEGDTDVAVIANFDDGESKPHLVVKPGEKLVQKNISGYGLPYDVVNDVLEYNR